MKKNTKQKIQKDKIIRKNRLAKIILFLYTKKTDEKNIRQKNIKETFSIKNFKERYTYYAR
ncbi:hypothetical protein P4679_22950 [Priestia megaterium]|uniref:hypothetical protein n=1 Tax=Priestia megaterium TaxID=1404 RepID=UPI002E1AC03E|nr:hypothetical protein [Priestia megaterium]